MMVASGVLLLLCEGAAGVCGVAHGVDALLEDEAER